MPKTATVVQSRADMVSGGVDGQDGFSMTPCQVTENKRYGVLLTTCAYNRARIQHVIDIIITGLCLNHKHHTHIRWHHSTACTLLSRSKKCNLNCTCYSAHTQCV